MGVDEAEVLAGRYKSVSGRYYVLHDPEKFTDKYITAWKNFLILQKQLNNISPHLGHLLEEAGLIDKDLCCSQT